MRSQVTGVEFANFLEQVLLLVREGQRFGQALFNHLRDSQPRLAEQVRGTRLDPFHKNDVSDIPQDFWNFVVENWDTSDSAVE